MTGTVFIRPQKIGHFHNFGGKKNFITKASPKIFLESANL